MGQADLSLNVMSLGGLALATGMVVDDSIVVLENIARLREEGHSILDATVKGASEVSMAVTASTLTTVAVFFPLVFVEGVAGQLFRDQSLTDHVCDADFAGRGDDPDSDDGVAAGPFAAGFPRRAAEGAASRCRGTRCCAFRCASCAAIGEGLFQILPRLIVRRGRLRGQAARPYGRRRAALDRTARRRHL